MAEGFDLLSITSKGWPEPRSETLRVAQNQFKIKNNHANCFLSAVAISRWNGRLWNCEKSKQKRKALSQHPTVNDELPNRIISGLVKVKGNVKEFTETAALFEDGSREDDIDAVIFATGYTFAFPFLEDSVQVVKNKVSLYKNIFPPNLEKPTLAIIGLIQPLGAIMPISELQGRWVTQVFKGKWPDKLTNYLMVCLIMFMFLLLNR